MHRKLGRFDILLWALIMVDCDLIEILVKASGCRWEELISVMMIHAEALLLDVYDLLNLTYAMPILIPGLG